VNDRVIKTIGLIGAGHIGSQIARLAVRNNYNVVISNSRGPETLSALVAELGPRTCAATVTDAAKAGDLDVVTVPAEELPVRSGRASGGQGRDRHEQLLPRT
jgi:predicted dinucleotide-binding enzyme